MGTHVSAVLLLLVIGGTSLRAAEDIPSEQLPFKDLGPIAVLIEFMSDDALKAGLSREVPKEYVELKLRQSRIPVCEMDDYSLEHPHLYVNAHAMQMTGLPNHFVFAVSTDLKQRVIRPRMPDDTITATTWTTGLAGHARGGLLEETVRDSIDGMLTRFCNQYLKANPVQRTPNPSIPPLSSPPILDDHRSQQDSPAAD